jgi:2-oxoglutarate dehydrogenase E1 component
MNLPPEYVNNLHWLQASFDAYQQDPKSVAPEVAAFFEGYELGQAGRFEAGRVHGERVPAEPVAHFARLQLQVEELMLAYRLHGHRQARINPLGGERPRTPELDLEYHGLSAEHADMVFHAPGSPLYAEGTLAQIVTDLHETYCGYIGVEYVHSQSTAEREWLRHRLEGCRNRPSMTHDKQMRALAKLVEAEKFEQFIHTRYRGQKRFSLEGSETLIPALDHLVNSSPLHGIERIVFGMAHRGRLNVLANIIGKDYDDIFSEFDDNYNMASAHGDGDVKYHKGYSRDIKTPSGATVHLSLASNPSHLEMVGAVVQGKVRADQALLNDRERRRVLPFVIHGDAAFAGQGIVAETLNMSQLRGYRTGGTIHLIINNQVGFTTEAHDYVSGLYCSDMAKMMGCPIFHVNGDSPDHVMHCIDVALEYRQAFQKDVVIDLWCYRRYGHNEADEPAFTQPVLYRKIRQQPSVVKIYAAQLQGFEKPGAEVSEELASAFEAQLETERAEAAANDPMHPIDDEFGGAWANMDWAYCSNLVHTRVDPETLKTVARAMTSTPENFDINPKIRKVFDEYLHQVESGGVLPWGPAELLAFGTLLLEGHGVRLSGEDVGRGTFTSRHAILYDQTTGEKSIPLCALESGPADFCVYDSPLAELAVLAFDYGFSTADPNKLVLWEAQFGDFANGAQVIIDQFIASGFSKWGRMNGLVMLLPHGYEGQGPEHSNGWLSRHLQLCAEENLQVIMPSTPAQYFHALRRQLHRPFRRPMVVMTPKSMLRRPETVSPISDFTSGGFREILDDTRLNGNAGKVRRVVFCAGKVWYDLMAEARAHNVKDVAIVRVEQFYPFPEEQWEEVAQRYAKAPEWVWVSEEPINYGAWDFMQAMLATMYSAGPIWCVGRARSASPATCSHHLHDLQQRTLVAQALQSGKLKNYLEDGVSVFRRGDNLWHKKSLSPLSANR